MSRASISKEDADHVFGPSDKPTYECELEPGGGWRFWCQHCKRYHHHGAGEGHRVAHCSDRSVHPKGYYLRLDE